MSLCSWHAVPGTLSCRKPLVNYTTQYKFIPVHCPDQLLWLGASYGYKSLVCRNSVTKHLGRLIIEVWWCTCIVCMWPLHIVQIITLYTCTNMYGDVMEARCYVWSYWACKGPWTESSCYYFMLCRVLPRAVRVMVSLVVLRMNHYCNQSPLGVAFPTVYSIVSGGQNSLSGGKRRLSGGWGWPSPPPCVGRTVAMIHCKLNCSKSHVRGGGGRGGVLPGSILVVTYNVPQSGMIVSSVKTALHVQ